MVQSFAVWFSSVSVIFSVQQTGPANTNSDQFRLVFYVKFAILVSTICISTIGSVQYPLFGLHMDNAYRFDCNWSTPMCHHFLKIHCSCYELAMQAIAHPNHICSRCSMAHLMLLYSVKGAM